LVFKEVGTELGFLCQWCRQGQGLFQ